ncbi:MAG TPA: rhomboid family intramembrane serine protease [Thermoanaerobaculia bacterium]|nr:rhomboid family intramembrane serine protease [Thermoanaerobaculia bacterium]
MSLIRSSRENLHSIYVLLFLNIAFFFLQIQDQERYQAIFQFERGAVLSGQLWRLFTYQFVQGSFLGSPALGLFFSLMVLYIMGSAVEEQLGTLHFAIFFLLSTLASAAVALLFPAPLLSSLFLSYSLLFVFARLNPDQTFYVFLVLPVKVRWIAYFALGILLLGVLVGSLPSIAAAGGAAASFVYFSLITNAGFPLPRKRRPALQNPLPEGPLTPVVDGAGEGNLVRFRQIKESLSGGVQPEIESLRQAQTAEIVRGVNICPSPADFKPENEDRYCVRCEGFAECSVRYIVRNSQQPLVEQPTA